ncbi:MAG: zinc metalloprotease HtpX [Bdellovibrionales bacterium]|jgi:heat shock protein HtpX|nr:zinc metalloprotease HtpX [Bdellovibrionales bacterium]
MNKYRYNQKKISNLLESFLILVGISILFIFLSYSLFGRLGFIFGGLIIFFSFVFIQTQAHSLALRLYKAQYLPPDRSPKLYHLVNQLGKSAGIEYLPQIYLIPHDLCLAFSTGNKKNPVIALSNGILSCMNQRELSGILAHEISHIAQGDLIISTLTQLIGRVASSFVSMASFILILMFPLIAFGAVRVNLTALLIVMGLPTIITLLQLKLSRTREYNADLEGSRLTGDPLGLASALIKMSHSTMGLFGPTVKTPPEFLSTHPETNKRVKALEDLADTFTP